MSTAALLSAEEDGYDAFDYVVDWIAGHEDPVSDATWTSVITELAETEGLSIGLAAYLAGRHGHAADAWGAAAGRDPNAARNLGVLRAERGDAQGAAKAFQVAIDSGRAEAAPWAARDLGLLRKDQGDLM